MGQINLLINPPAYDPEYHYKLAIEAKLSAYAAPYGFLEAGSESFAGQIPTILKINSSNSLNNQKYQSLNGSVDALRLGCSAIGFTIYPGSEYQYDMIEEFKYHLKHLNMDCLLCCGPRGGNISKEGETALDIISYAAHIAAQLEPILLRSNHPVII